MYLFSKANRTLLALGITQPVRQKMAAPTMQAPIKYGTSMRRKLTPLLRIATNSVRAANCAVTKTVAMKMVMGLSRLA